MSQGQHFVQNAPQAPNVRLLVVWFFLANFRGKVIRSSDGSRCAVIGVLEHSSNTEVSDFDLVRLSHEDVLSFQVSVEDLAVVDVLNCQAHLHKPI